MFYAILRNTVTLKMQSSRLLSRVLSRNIIKRNTYDHHSPVQSTYNDLPQPQGSWKTNYDAKQRKYNGQLAFGIGFFIFTILVGKSAGFLETYNDYPEKATKIDSYK